MVSICTCPFSNAKMLKVIPFTVSRPENRALYDLHIVDVL